MCDWNKVIKSGLAAGLVMLVAGLVLMLFWQAVFPATQAEYKSGLYRPWGDPLMQLFFLYPFILGLAMAYAYGYFRSAFKGKDFAANGAKYGFMVWLLAGLPGMFVTYASFVVSAQMALSWTLSGLAEMLLGGIAVSKVWERK